jgi:hypothetical protein
MELRQKNGSLTFAQDSGSINPNSMLYPVCVIYCSNYLPWHHVRSSNKNYTPSQRREFIGAFIIITLQKKQFYKINCRILSSQHGPSS